jgi:hypothetical protein
MSSKAEELIAAERAQIEKALEAALAARDGANEMVKALRAELYAAPRLHVRRTRKARVASLMEDSGYSRAEAKAIVAEDMDEMPVADLELTSGGEIKVRRL